MLLELAAGTQVRGVNTMSSSTLADLYERHMTKLPKVSEVAVHARPNAKTSWHNHDAGDVVC